MRRWRSISRRSILWFFGCSCRGCCWCRFCSWSRLACISWRTCQAWDSRTFFIPLYAGSRREGVFVYARVKVGLHKANKLTNKSTQEKGFKASLSTPPSRFSDDTGATKGAISTAYTQMAYRCEAILALFALDALLSASFVSLHLRTPCAYWHVKLKVVHQRTHFCLAPLCSVDYL